MRIFGIEIKKAKKTQSKTIKEDDIITRVSKSNAKILKEEMQELDRQLLITERKIQLARMESKLSEYESIEEEEQEEQEETGELSPENMLMQTFLSAMNKPQQEQTTLSQQVPQQAQNELELSEEAIRQLIKEQGKKKIGLARKLPNDDLKALLKQQTPIPIGEKTLLKAVEIIKNG